jgi:hypothetical protein
VRYRIGLNTYQAAPLRGAGPALPTPGSGLAACPACLRRPGRSRVVVKAGSSAGRLLWLSILRLALDCPAPDRCLKAALTEARCVTYRQMAIRQQKAGNYSQALWWAERGIALYGRDCARPEALEDLRGRAAKYRAKLASPGL